MGNFERELEKYNLKVSDIEVSNKLFDKLQEAIDTMQMNGYYGDLEVILNSNLLVHKNLSKKIDTIFGMKVTFQDLEECVSFVVKPYEEKTADQMFEELGYEKKENGLHNVARYKKDDDNIIYFREATKYSEADVHKSGEYCETCYGITMQELKAINKKCEELGWI